VADQAVYPAGHQPVVLAQLERDRPGLAEIGMGAP